MAPEEGEEVVLTMKEKKILTYVEVTADDMKQVMKPKHLFSFTKEEEEEDLFGMLNIFIVKNMITPLNFAGRKLKMRRGESSFMHEGEKKSEDDALFLACDVEEMAHDEVWYIDNGSVSYTHLTLPTIYSV